MTTFLPGRRHPHVWEGAPLVAYKWSPKQCDKDMANPNQVVCLISCQGLCTQLEWLNLEFQFTATNLTSMAAKLSDLGDKTSGANLQTEGHRCNIIVSVPFYIGNFPPYVVYSGRMSRFFCYLWNRDKHHFSFSSSFQNADFISTLQFTVTVTVYNQKPEYLWTVFDTNIYSNVLISA